MKIFDTAIGEMVQIWQMEPYPCGDPRLPHHVFPPKMITPDELSKRTGTLYWKLDTLDQISLSKRLKLMKTERHFNKEDIFTLDAETTANFKDKIDELFEESNQPADQARMVIEGSAYYDVEDKNGDWVRILCEFGDLILIPANTSFRFTTTPRNFVKMRRFYKDGDE
ncbi:ARD/ARD' family protein [Dictyocaulus viviparus]|uniref:ARD/ARD' family protein n=1 Tax=Dictyocaulus viviparus TaxID=29172 RepID=A0A0D8YBJ1_DICVI|nr:ARD/ARD' family protein [Dictyocaulus viviparus]